MWYKLDIVWVMNILCLQKRPPQRLRRQPVLKSGNRVRERVAPPLLVCKNILLNYNSRNCVQELVSVKVQLSAGYKFWLVSSPLITTIDCVVEMETKKRPINDPLVFSSIVLSFAACFVALIHVEIELHAHRKMLQVLTQQREESIHSLGTVNDKSIASTLCSDTGKGECFGLLVRFSQA